MTAYLRKQFEFKRNDLLTYHENIPVEKECGTVENVISLYRVQSNVPAKPCIVVFSLDIKVRVAYLELSMRSTGSLFGWENLNNGCALVNTLQL